MAINVNRNKCLNIIYKYGIEYNKSNIEEIEKKLKKKIVYFKIYDLNDSTRIIELTNKWFIVEFDLKRKQEIGKRFK